MRDMQAIVFTTGGYCAVTSNDIGENWRGDLFEPALRSAIHVFTAAQKARGEASILKLVKTQDC